MTTKQEVENELKQWLEEYKGKINELENKLIKIKSQTDPVNQKIRTEKINSLKTTLQFLSSRHICWPLRL